jgi:hypothetical protein
MAAKGAAESTGGGEALPLPAATVVEPPITAAAAASTSGGGEALPVAPVGAFMGVAAAVADGLYVVAALAEEEMRARREGGDRNASMRFGSRRRALAAFTTLPPLPLWEFVRECQRPPVPLRTFSEALQVWSASSDLGAGNRPVHAFFDPPPRPSASADATPATEAAGAMITAGPRLVGGTTVESATPLGAFSLSCRIAVPRRAWRSRRSDIFSWAKKVVIGNPVWAQNPQAKSSPPIQAARALYGTAYYGTASNMLALILAERSGEGGRGGSVDLAWRPHPTKKPTT